MNRKAALLFVPILTFSFFTCTSWSQVGENASPSGDVTGGGRPEAGPTDRIIGPIDDDQRIVLLGQHHPLAKPEYATGDVPPDQRLERMVLVMRGSGAQEAEVAELTQAQQDPGSASYHQWLTPQTFGQRFGVSPNDVEKVAAWLQTHGMEMEEIPASKRAIVFSGTSAQVEATFHTTMKTYSVNGESHFANASDPEIPQALAEVVAGVLSLHDFVSAPLHVAAPAFTTGGAHYLMPQDWATIYDVNPLYNQGITGTGESIAVLGRVDILVSDVSAFRSAAGLPANNPTIIVNGADPGTTNSNDQVESSLDVEWAGAIARSATVKFVTSKSGSSDGVALSAQYAVGHNVAPIVSLSYGLCEASEGASGNAFWNSLWQQAAAQGMSVFVSAGDSGAAGCDSASSTKAVYGRGVNGLCSSPYSTCVGGTEFSEGPNTSQYWSASNGSGMSSALSYIPESTWNESGGGSGLWAGGGGASVVYSKPSWQSALGVPADGQRDVPDVSMSASIHDSYIIEMNGQLWSVGGTSAAAPSLASALALALENAGAEQGNLNPILYGLATRQLSDGDVAMFHDLTVGNNSVPGVTGFNAGTGYDQATGLGSIDANLLVSHWKDGSATFVLTPSSSSLTVGKGYSNTLSLTLTASGGFNSAVTLAASGAPTGVTVKFSSTTLTAAAPVTVTISATTSAAAGTSTITISGTGAGVQHTAQIALTIVTPTFTLTPSLTSFTLAAGTPASVTLTTAGASSFESAISLSLAGLPKGVTAAFSPTSIAAPGNGSSTLTLNAASSTATAGSATVTVTATGGGVTKTQAIGLTVIVPTFTLGANPTSGTLAMGSSKTFTLTTAAGSGFSSAVALSVTGLPKGVTAAFSPTSIASPGGGNSTLTLKAASAATSGAGTVTVTATGGGVTKTQALSLTVPAPSFTLAFGAATVTVKIGGATQIGVSTDLLNGFNSAVALSLAGLPRGVTARFSPTSIPASSGSGSTLTLTAGSSSAAGSYGLTVTAKGGGVSKTQALALTVIH